MYWTQCGRDAHFLHDNAWRAYPPMGLKGGSCDGGVRSHHVPNKRQGTHVRGDRHGDAWVKETFAGTLRSLDISPTPPPPTIPAGGLECISVLANSN